MLARLVVSYTPAHVELGAESWGRCCSLLLPQMLLVSWSSICSSGSAAPRLRAGTSQGVLLIAFSYLIISRQLLLAWQAWRCLSSLLAVPQQ